MTVHSAAFSEGTSHSFAFRRRSDLNVMCDDCPAHALCLLSMKGDRPLPDCFKQRYGSIDIGNRGGIITKGTSLNVPLD